MNEPADEAVPFEIVNPHSGGRLLLVCEHASSFIPARYAGLGLSAAELSAHIAWDIGAADVTRRLAQRLDAPAVLCGTSRLVIDCNRGLANPDSIVSRVDGIVVPGNRRLAAAERELRAARYFRPYHRAVEAQAERLGALGAVPAVIPMHSFTPLMNGVARPWHVGVLWSDDARLARPLIAALGAEPALVVGDNQPYSDSEPESYALATHGAAHGRPHVEIEIRQNEIDSAAGAARWAELLGRVLGDVLAARSLV